MPKNRKSGGSLQDQLRLVGLVTEKQVKKAQKNIHRQEMRVKQGLEVDESKQAAEQVIAQKQERDRKENEARNQAALAKALQAQIRQLIETNSQRQQGDVPYNFTDGSKIKKIYISEANKLEINKGFLAIVKTGDAYDLVPEIVARRISDRIPDDSASVIMYLFDRSKDLVDEDDPYKDFQIPDDLEW